MNIEQKRQQTDERWRVRFEEAGLSERFEFIGQGYGRSGRKLSNVKCKSCGHKFDTYGVDAVSRKLAKTMCCPQCGMKSDGTIQWTKSPIREEAIAFYLDGHTRQEVVAKFGISVVQFDNELQAQGITKTSEQRREAWSASLKKAGNKANENAKMRAMQKRIEHLDSLGFDYIDEHDNKGVVKCRTCGCVFERTKEYLSQGNVTCSNCKEIERIEKQRNLKKQKEEHKKKQEAERVNKNPLGLSYYQFSIQEKYDVVRVCEVCGNEYTIRDRMTKEGLKYCRDNGCCSKECAKKRARKAQKIRERGYKNHKGRAHKYGCAFDSSVTLKALIKRNGLRCAICGEMCDPDDHEWTDYTGPKRPTIDHIIPMSKGGGHVWDNVQIAHALCNSIKRDAI